MDFLRSKQNTGEVMKLVVKNTFLEFELHERRGNENSRRRASSFPANCGRDCLDDSGDSLETEVGSTDGTDCSTPSWGSEVAYPGDSSPTHACDTSPTHACDVDFLDFSIPKYGEWSMMDDMQHGYGSTFTDAWTGAMHNFDNALLGVDTRCTELDMQAHEFSVAAFHAEIVAQQTHTETGAKDDASQLYYEHFPNCEWRQQSLLASPTTREFPLSTPGAWNAKSGTHAKHNPPRRPAPIESPRRGGVHQSPHHSPNWIQRTTYNVPPKSPTVATSPASKIESKYTTIMLRNLPNDYTRDMLMDLLESQGFGGWFNFVYLPFDFRKNAGLGYAFVNMTSNQVAKRAMRDLTGFRDWKLKSQKVLQVTWSTPLQGLWSNVERYRNSPVMHAEVPEKFKPLLLADGVPIEFPPPTKTLQAPNTTSPW